MANDKNETYEVGQTLFFRGRHAHKRSEPVTITKVGRAWLTLSNGHRANITDLSVDGGCYSSPAQCYLSEKEFNDEVMLAASWQKFKDDIKYMKVTEPQVTIENIAQLRKMLGI